TLSGCRCAWFQRTGGCARSRSLNPPANFRARLRRACRQPQLDTRQARLQTQWSIPESSLYQLFGSREELRVVPLEILDPAAFEVPDSGCHFVDHIMIVSHQEQSAGISLQRDVQSVDGFQVEMVRRFVQNQEVGFLQHQAAENDSRRFT